MSRATPWIFVGGLAAALVAFAPLSAAVAWMGLDRLGLSAVAAEGSVWSGRLRQASLRGLPLGEIAVALEPLPLLSGTARLRARVEEGPMAGRAVLVRSGPVTSVEGATGTAPLSMFRTRAPLQGLLAFENLTVRFVDGRCSVAEGRVSTKGLQPIAGFGGAALVGAARCDRGALLLPLRGRVGPANVELRLNIEGDGRYRVDTVVASGDPAVNASLRLAGFVPEGQGQARVDEGRLWR